MEPSKIKIASDEGQQIKEFIEVSIEYLKSLGQFALKIGETEKKFPNAFKLMQIMSTPENMATLVSKAPPKLVAKMVEFMLRASSLTVKMNKNINDLTADEKIALGNELIKLANDAATLMEAKLEDFQPKEEVQIEES